MSAFPSAVGNLEEASAAAPPAADRHAQWQQAKDAQKNIYLEGRGLFRASVGNASMVLAATSVALLMPGIATTIGVAVVAAWSLKSLPSLVSHVSRHKAANRNEERLREQAEASGFVPVVGEATPLERKRDRLEDRIEGNERRIDSGFKWGAGLAVAGVAALGAAVAAPGLAGLMMATGACVATASVLTGAITAANALKSRFERAQLARVEAKIEDEAVNGPAPSIIDRLFKRRSTSQNPAPDQKSDRGPSM